MKTTVQHPDQRKIDARFLLAVVTLIVAQFVALFSQPTRPFTYLWFAMAVAILIIGYAKGRVFGLLSSLVAVFLFGSFNLYVYFIAHDVSQLAALDVLWFFLFPLCAFAGGHLGDYLRHMLGEYEQIYGSVDELLLADPLTGLASKKRFFFDLQEEIERARRHFIRRERKGEVTGHWAAQTLEETPMNEMLTVMLFELVHFNEFALLYGEAQSNRLQAAIAESLQASCRLSDRKAKLDRARFAVILPETPAANAQVVRDRLHEALETYRVETRDMQTRDIGLTLRFGFATAPQDGATVEEIYSAAERELQFDLG